MPWLLLFGSAIAISMGFCLIWSCVPIFRRIRAARIRPAQVCSAHPDRPKDGLSVSIVPSEENHPLDWNEPSIADELDLRRRRSVSSWLGKKNGKI